MTDTHIHEIYLSISGEGITTGVPTIFIRLAGCSLRCGKTQDGRKLWCDTPYALSPRAGKPIALEEILDEVNSLQPPGGAQILISGGEPLEKSNKILTQSICDQFQKFCKNPNFPWPRIETNGAENLEGLDNMVFTMDYKLPGSGMEDRMDVVNFSILNARKNPLDEIKFVIRDRLDFERSLEVCSEFRPDPWILFSPVTDELHPKELADWMKSTHLPKARLSLQTHKAIWGNQRGV